MEFTLQQQAAIDQPGHTLVTACPGAGKTRVIIERAARLLENRNNNLALVTFTRAAAKEMHQRLSLRVRTERARINTFHKYAMLQFRELDHDLKVASNSEIASAIWSVINITGYGHSYEEARTIIDDLNTELYPQELKNIDPQSWDMFKLYRRLLQKQNAVDLSEVSRLVVLGMREGDIVPLPISHLLVDEFQDVDAVQLAWVEEHIKRGIEVTVVGDDDQSIYAFRKALGYTGIASFLQVSRASIHKLETCFRCPAEITDHAGLLIACNHGRMDKDVYSHKGPGGDIMHIGCTDPTEEAETIAAVVGRVDGTTAVLARRNLDLDDIECVLAAHGIAYHRASSQQFWMREIVSLYLQLLVTITHPSQTLGACAVLAYLKYDDKVIERFQHALQSSSAKDLADVDTDTDPVLVSLTRLIATSREILPNWKPVIRKTGDWVTKLIGQAESNKSRRERQSRLVGLATEAILSLDGDLPTILKRLQMQKKYDDDEIPQDAITLGTFHGAKGLEYENVWLIRADYFDESELSIDEIEEERRLFYVAMTRAQNRLYISTTQREPSRFLYEAGLIREYEEASTCINY